MGNGHHDSRRIDDSVAGISVDKEHISWLEHQYYLRIVPITLSRWGKHISEQQNEDIIKVIETHEHVLRGIFPAGKVPDQNYYDNFFCQVRDIKGLKR